MLYCPNPAGWNAAVLLNNAQMTAATEFTYPPHGKEAVHKTTGTAAVLGDKVLDGKGPAETRTDAEFWSLVGDIVANVSSPKTLAAASLPYGVSSLGIKFDDKGGSGASAVPTTTNMHPMGPIVTGVWPTVQKDRVWWFSENGTQIANSIGNVTATSASAPNWFDSVVSAAHAVATSPSQISTSAASGCQSAIERRRERVRMVRRAGVLLRSSSWTKELRYEALSSQSKFTMVDKEGAGSKTTV